MTSSILLMNPCFRTFHGTTDTRTLRGKYARSDENELSIDVGNRTITMREIRAKEKRKN